MKRLTIDGLTRITECSSGDHSTVYEAWQTEFNRRVAVKVFHDRSDTDAPRRFQREREAAARLSDHSGILQVHGSGTTADGELYTIMAFVPCGTLQDELNQGGRFDVQKAVNDVIAVAEAVDFAHRRGVIHRDVRPATICRSAAREPLLSHFGLATIADFDGGRPALLTASIPFAAPELLSDGVADVASDVYSLGALLYTLLAGKPVFVDSRMNEPPPIPGVPMQVLDVVRSAMAKTPIHRPASALLFAQYLRFAMHETRSNPAAGNLQSANQLAVPIAASPPPGPVFELRPLPTEPPRTPRPSREGRSLVLAATAVALVMLGGLTIARFTSTSTADVAGVADADDVATGASIETPGAIVLGAVVTPTPLPTLIPDPSATPTVVEIPTPIASLSGTVSDGPTPSAFTRFAAVLPDRWEARKDNVDVGYGYRSELVGPNTDFLIVDTTPKDRLTGGATVEDSARSIASSLSSASPVTMERMGNKDTYWFTYTGDDGSRRIDIFFEANGHGYAVIGGSYGSPDTVFAVARDFVRSLEST